VSRAGIAGAGTRVQQAHSDAAAFGMDTHPQFTEADEGRHAAQEHPLWQESVLLHWYDRRQGIGGWHRIGHEPNNDGGRAAIWSCVRPRGWQYRRCGEVTLVAEDRIRNGLRAGSRTGSSLSTARHAGRLLTVPCRPRSSAGTCFHRRPVSAR
jgi:hypothetical protein